MTDIEAEDWTIVEHNKAALALLRDQAHHSVSCQREREQAKNSDVCRCGLMIHLADVVREEREHYHPSW